MKNFLKSILFTVIFVLIFIVLSFALLPKDTLKKYGLIKTSRYEILFEKEDSIDIIFAGDSLTYSSISPMDLWTEYGYTSYDIAYPAQKINDMYRNIEVAIESQHPKIVFMEANVLMRDGRKAKWYYNTTDWRNTYLPLIAHHNNWKKYLFTNIKDSLRYSWVDPFKGFKYVPDIQKGRFADYMDDENEKIKKIPNNNFEYLKKIKDLCDKNDVKFILLSTPNSGSWSYGKYLAAKKAAKDLDIPYIELNVGNPLHINWETETKDEGFHLNYDGALKVTRFLGDYLRDNGLAVDHRGDDYYSEWEDAYIMFEDNKK